MAVKKNQGKTKGRPVLVKTDPIDLAKVEIFARLGASTCEIADYFNCDVRTIQRYMEDEESAFCRTFKKARSEFKLRVRRKQVQRLDEGSDTMCIWLGKVELGQKEPEVTLQTVGDLNLTIVRKEKRDD